MFLLGQCEKELLLSARVTDSELSVQHTAYCFDVFEFFYIHDENRLLCSKMEKSVSVAYVFTQRFSCQTMHTVRSHAAALQRDSCKHRWI